MVVELSSESTAVSRDSIHALRSLPCDVIIKITIQGTQNEIHSQKTHTKSQMTLKNSNEKKMTKNKNETAFLSSSNSQQVHKI